ncbi:response regulator [Candidatus Woesearchaeota archaeon]|jgi:DNA-binding response OmpR family regulator|nr:response regulator [Candidatus Woesearchaeota archaeon]MBT4110389.1 response regulator [Candidatus Woesearchaeota archaeon]MBT4336087.1 response regulator [Candidatus Woesearchaeota archaeon]MBT4468934.1 response regulator [Candidatus Woesearchaeota archaeon]MBT6744747.1 response regulator [Candidatus Woesearchaeota archaeon]
MKKEYLIMSVDDENDIRDSIKSVLEDEGFKVETAKDGASMLKKLEKIKPDLILLDILMPGLTTREIITEVKKRKIKTPVIFLTVVRLAEATKKHVIKGNMVDYIEKPFDNKDLIKRVKRALKTK